MNNLSSNSIGITYNINRRVEIRLHGYIFLETTDFKNFIFLNEDIEYKVDNIELNNNSLSITIGGVTKNIITNVKEVLNVWRLITSVKDINFYIEDIDTKLDFLISVSGIRQLRVYEKYDRFIDIDKEDSTFYLQTYSPRIKKKIISIVFDNDVLKIKTEDTIEYLSIRLTLHPLISNIIENNI